MEGNAVTQLHVEGMRFGPVVNNAQWREVVVSLSRQPTYDSEEDPNQHWDFELHRDVQNIAATPEHKESKPFEHEEPEHEVSSPITPEQRM
ncbi:hypothetical protein Tco_0920198 [Tanacetum coccineum]